MFLKRESILRNKDVKLNWLNFKISIPKTEKTSAIIANAISYKYSNI